MSLQNRTFAFVFGVPVVAVPPGIFASITRCTIITTVCLFLMVLNVQRHTLKRR